MLLDGDDRARPRSPSTLYTYYAAARPFLHHWATEHDHLAERDMLAERTFASVAAAREQGRVGPAPDTHRRYLPIPPWVSEAVGIVIERRPPDCHGP